MNGMPKSPSDDEKDLLDPEKESETSLWKTSDADDNVKDEVDGCSENELEEDKHGKLISLSFDIGCLASILTTFLFLIFNEIILFKRLFRASLVAQWLRICLPVQGTRVRALVWEDPTCRGATTPVSHNY